MPTLVEFKHSRLHFHAFSASSVTIMDPYHSHNQQELRQHCILIWDMNNIHTTASLAPQKSPKQNTYLSPEFSCCTICAFHCEHSFWNWL